MISEILTFLKNKYAEKNVITCKGVRISKTNFQTFNPEFHETSVYAIDGGCSILYDAGTWFIAKIKVGHAEYLKNKAGETSKKYYMAGIFNEDGFSAEFFPKNNLTPTQKEVESWVSDKGLSIDKISDIVSRVMKISEWKYAYELLTKIIDGIVLMDSLLMEDFPHHAKYMRPAVDAAIEKNLMIVGVSKTSRLGTNTGRPLVSYLESIGPESAWAYKIPSKGSSSRMFGVDYAVKFHSMSKHVFRVQFEKNVHEKLSPKKALSLMAFYSKDPEMLGYPFPLYSVDKLVRLGHMEKRDEKWKIIMHEGEYKFLKDCSASDFHGSMDRRTYR
ncbi:MAG: DNA double-strand break repair nuclease NurA [Nanoarchaeota archaeon]|nr:DNA double-strand break repair nuclease NurA [Nanoarchaeota archaeon]